jgi:nicotinate-nucleotide pyrophosphorylase (carboxylating)
LADPGDPDAADLPDLETDAQELARRLLAEDGSDLTTDLTVPSGAFGAAAIRARSATIAAGVAYADAVAREAGCDGLEWKVEEGAAVPAAAMLGAMHGDLTAMLRAERPLLNLLQRACGIAAATRSFVDAVAGTGCRVLHTRKTAPGLRSFDIRAVLAGGGALHRVGLERVVMVKDNHWVALGRAGRSLEQVCREARERGAQAVQIEVESAAQVEAACRAGADRLLISRDVCRAGEPGAPARPRDRDRGDGRYHRAGGAGVRRRRCRLRLDRGAHPQRPGCRSHAGDRVASRSPQASSAATHG